MSVLIKMQSTVGKAMTVYYTKSRNGKERLTNSKTWGKGVSGAFRLPGLLMLTLDMHCEKHPTGNKYDRNNIGR